MLGSSDKEDYDDMFGSSSEDDDVNNERKHEIDKGKTRLDDSEIQCTSSSPQHTSSVREEDDYNDMFGSDRDCDHEGEQVNDGAVVIDDPHPSLAKHNPVKQHNVMGNEKQEKIKEEKHRPSLVIADVHHHSFPEHNPVKQNDVMRNEKQEKTGEEKHRPSLVVSDAHHPSRPRHNPVKQNDVIKNEKHKKLRGEKRGVSGAVEKKTGTKTAKAKAVAKSSGLKGTGWIGREALWADSSSDSDSNKDKQGSGQAGTKKPKPKNAMKRARQGSDSVLIQKTSVKDAEQLRAQDHNDSSVNDGDGTVSRKRARRDSKTKEKRLSAVKTVSSGKGDKKGKETVVSVSASDVLAIARQRRKSQQVVATTNSAVAVPKKKPQAPITVPTMKRKSSLTMLLTKSGSGTLLATSAMKRDTSTGVSGNPKPTKHYPKVEVEQYFRSLRDWDFLRDLSDHMLAQQRGGKGEKEKKKKTTDNDSIQLKEVGDVDEDYSSSDSPPIAKKKAPLSAKTLAIKTDANPPPPLPDRFESSQQYKALWAPLLLGEVKSQILSDITATSASMWARTGGSGGCGALVRQVTVLPVNPADVDGYAEAMDVVIRGDGGGPGRGGGRGRSRGGGNASSPADSFAVNDVVLLFSELSSIVRAATGKLTDEEAKAVSRLVAGVKGKRLGFLGHAVNHRSRSVDGLILKVSRRLWKVAGQNEMYMVRVGGSVTAIREFMALCRVDKIPLMKYLLGGNTSSHSNTMISSSSDDMLSTMSGKNSLGIGFRIYVKSKFNQSQLGAITAAAREYGGGGFTLVKGPPGTGKTTTLVALLNALHLRQYQRYYNEIERITTSPDTNGESSKGSSSFEFAEEIASFNAAAKVKPRILVCAPSNAAVDNVILKIMEDRFVDGNGGRYGPSIVRVGVGQSSFVRDVNLKVMIDAILAEGADVMKLESLVVSSRKELNRIQTEIRKLKRRVRALASAVSYTLSNDWEIRIDEESFDLIGRVIFINHKTKTATVDPPPPVQPGETPYPTNEMPHYKGCMDALVKYVEKQNNLTSKLEQYIIVQNTTANMKEGLGRQSQETALLIQQLETHILDSMHIVLTTLGSAGSRVVESAEKFEVVVVDEAAQSSEPASLVALQLGSSHAILVGDPQQLPATIFSVSGRTTKYDRSLFQRLEESGHPVHMLDTQYRMDKNISEFPRRIFYDGRLLDGPNVQSPDYGGELRKSIKSKFKYFQPFTIFDLDSAEERDGTSLSNADEAHLALHLYCTLEKETDGISSKSRTAVITPYSQQVALLRRTFAEKLGERFSTKVEISTVDAFQGKEAKIVIFSCVRGAGRGVGIGFLSDVQRMNVALTRAKHFLFVIARCRSIMVNPYWRDLVAHARERRAILKVPIKEKQEAIEGTCSESKELTVDLKKLIPLHPITTNGPSHNLGDGYSSEGEFSA